MIAKPQLSLVSENLSLFITSALSPDLDRYVAQLAEMSSGRLNSAEVEIANLNAALNLSKKTINNAENVLLREKQALCEAYKKITRLEKCLEEFEKKT